MSDAKKVEIVESCGCVFCDLGLEPEDLREGRPAHIHRDKGIGYSICTNDELTPSQEQPNV